MIYDYLFYKSYQLGKWSRNFEDIPVLAGVMWVSMCFMFNVFTITFILEGLGYLNSVIFDTQYKFIYSLALILLLIFYYTYKGRYKRIIEKYEEKASIKGKGIHPVIVIALYYVISFALGTLAAMYKRHYGIFS
jgi:hypothetical protein